MYLKRARRHVVIRCDFGSKFCFLIFFCLLFQTDISSSLTSTPLEPQNTFPPANFNAPGKKKYFLHVTVTINAETMKRCTLFRFVLFYLQWSGAARHRYAFFSLTVTDRRRKDFSFFF